MLGPLNYKLLTNSAEKAAVLCWITAYLLLPHRLLPQMLRFKELALFPAGTVFYTGNMTQDTWSIGLYRQEESTYWI
jgi:hypothetical protein